MASLNQVALIGFVGDEPSVVQTKTGEYLASMRIATTERGFTKKDGTKVEDKTEWHNVVFFGSVAEKLIAPYVHKGSMVFVQGKLRTRAYDGKDGVKRYVTEIVGDVIQLLDRKNQQSQSSSSPSSSSSSFPSMQSPISGTPLFGKDGFLESGQSNDDVPF